MIEHIWLLGDERYLLIEEDVIDTLNSFRQLESEPEAGGCLFGFYRGDHIHISDCTYPQGNDTRLPLRFDRRDTYHLEYASQLYKKSNNTCTYLGDWHTHPQELPAPSSFDYSEWDKITELRKNWQTTTIVVGRKGFWVGVGDIDNPIRKHLKKL